MKPVVLIVDDEENIRFSLSRFLSQAGYDVKSAGTFKKAVKLINSCEFDVIFTDILLEDASGIDILQEVKQKKRISPVILFTGIPKIENATEAVRLGAFDYLPKPVRQDTLLKSAEAALRYKRLVEEKERYRNNLEAIFKSVKDSIITVDKDLKVVEVNDAAQKICQISRSNALGKNLTALAKGCNGHCVDIIKKTINTKSSMESQRFACHTDGQPEQTVTVTTFPFLDRNGSIQGGILVARDETHLYQLEKSLEKRAGLHNIIGKNKRMQEVYTLIENLADVQTTVLITGETGTGKELVAEALHYRSSNPKKPLIKVNCAAISEDLLESELFGHVKGAFTGAIDNKIGLLQQADGGTIFFDEIGEISHKMQLRLLRVLQEMEFKRVGEAKSIRVNLRVIAATNQDLPEAVINGTFRKDLYYRLKVVEVHLPLLRKRLDDLDLLVSHFIHEFNATFNKSITGISSEVKSIFLSYPWSGNVRELKHTIEHAFILCKENTIAVANLPSEFQSFTNKQIQNSENMKILDALEKTKWNKTEAAQLLGISRQTLYRKMKALKLS